MPGDSILIWANNIFILLRYDCIRCLEFSTYMWNSYTRTTGTNYPIFSPFPPVLFNFQSSIAHKTKEVQAELQQENDIFLWLTASLGWSKSRNTYDISLTVISRHGTLLNEAALLDLDWDFCASWSLLFLSGFK